MDKKTLKECAEKMVTLKKEAAESLRNISENQAALEESNSQGGDDIDHSNNLNELVRLKNISRQLSLKCIQLDAAQKRMDAGKFGICLTCEDDIPKNRLVANPLSIRCISCQEDLEQIQKEDKMRSRRSASNDSSAAISDDE